jgi:hypothetical protein
MHTASFNMTILIALMMETKRTSETSVNFYQTTRRNNSEGRHFPTRCRKNLRSHLALRDVSRNERSNKKANPAET